MVVAEVEEQFEGDHDEDADGGYAGCLHLGGVV